MNLQKLALTPGAFIECVRGGRWSVRLAPPELGPANKSVVDARLEGDHLLVEFEGKTIDLMTGQMEIVQDSVRKGEEAETIRVRLPALVHEQRKQAEGGGWHDVSRLRDFLVVVNVEATTRNAERHRANEEAWRRASELEQGRRLEGELASRQSARDAYLARTLAEVRDKTVARIEFREDTVTIVFASGESLSFSATKQDSYDVRENPYLTSGFEGAENSTDSLDPFDE